MKGVISVIIAVIVIYLLLVAFYALMQRSLIYYPYTLSTEQAHYQAQALGGEAWLDSSDQWQGWKITSGDQPINSHRARAVVFHGNAGMALNRDYYADLLSGFEASGPWEVYIFEYPGYGPRPGKPSEAALVDRALDAIDQLMAEDPAPVLIIGESIGSGMASAIADSRSSAVEALLLITPFDSLVNLARHHMPFLPAGLLLRDRLNNLDALADYDRPLIIVTAGTDQIVPAEFAEPLLEQHQGLMLHVSQPDAGHNTLQFDPGHSTWSDIDLFLASLQ